MKNFFKKINWRKAIMAFAVALFMLLIATLIAIGFFYRVELNHIQRFMIMFPWIIIIVHASNKAYHRATDKTEIITVSDTFTTSEGRTEAQLANDRVLQLANEISEIGAIKVKPYPCGKVEEISLTVVV